MRALRHGRMRAALLVAIGLLCAGLFAVLYATDAVRSLELDTVDTRFSIRGTEKPPRDLVIVKIDDVTFDELDRRWPFRRTVHARAVDRIAADRPKAIVYDVQFTEKSANPNDDVALAESIYNADGKVVLATTEVSPGGHTRILNGDAVLKEIGAHPGNGLLPLDPGGVLRRLSYQVDGLRTIGVVGASVAAGKPVKPFGGTPWIDYRGPPGTIPSVSFSRVVRGEVPKGFFRGKVVVVGPSAPSLQDVHPTSTTGGNEMSGAEIQANAFDTVRRGLPLLSTAEWVDYLLIALLALAAPLLSLVMRPLRAILAALVLGALFAVAVQVAFVHGRVVGFVYAEGALVVSCAAVLAVYYLTTALERERVRDLFSRFVPENVVDDVLARADDGLRLGGVQRDGTVMFCDLRGFTTFAETLPPDRVIELLNVYLTEMSDAILDHGGTLVAYMGDGIMAVFGAPLEQPDHAQRGLDTAREMLATRLPRFNAYLAEQGLGGPFRMGIGLNSGPVMSGNVGSERRLEYTAIGDTTNTAARIEGMTKGTPHQLFVAESVRDRLDGPADDLVFVDEMEVRGRAARVRLWALADEGSAGDLVAEVGQGAAGAPEGGAGAT